MSFGSIGAETSTPGDGQDEVLVVTAESPVRTLTLTNGTFDLRNVPANGFACTGITYYGTIGFCLTGLGEPFVYAGFAYPNGIDGHTGYATNRASNYLTGGAISSNIGLGAGVSINNDLSFSRENGAFLVGTRGVSLTYGAPVPPIRTGPVFFMPRF